VLEGPLMIGPRAHVGPEAIIGAYSVLGRGASIGEGAVVNSSVIWPDGVVEPGAELTECIVADQYLARADRASPSRPALAGSGTRA
jgi:mannose-1-phosphate guanylyltransferase/phosphomannomutase